MLTDVGSRDGLPVGRGSAELEGGDGGVDEDVLVGRVGEVERGFGDQGTPDRSQGRLGSQPGRRAGVGGSQQGMQLLVLGVQARTDGGVVEDRDVGGDQRDDLPVGDEDGQVGVQQLAGGPGCGGLGVWSWMQVSMASRRGSTRWCSRASLDR